MKSRKNWKDYCAPDPHAVALAEALLEPVMRILFRVGLSTPQIGMIARGKGLEAAAALIAAGGRKVRATDVAAITGTMRRTIPAKGRPQVWRNDRHLVRPASRVIAVWRWDRKYLDDSRSPAVLPMRGRISFTSLVHEHGRDVTPKAILHDLVSNGAAQVLSNQSVRLVADALVPDMPSAEQMATLARKACVVLERADKRIAQLRTRKPSPAL